MKEKVGTIAQELALLRLAMRTMRGRYMDNVRTGKVKHEPNALTEFDNQLEILNVRSKSISTKR